MSDTIARDRVVDDGRQTFPAEFGDDTQDMEGYGSDVRRPVCLPRSRGSGPGSDPVESSSAAACPGFACGLHACERSDALPCKSGKISSSSPRRPPGSAAGAAAGVQTAAVPRTTPASAGAGRHHPADRICIGRREAQCPPGRRHAAANSPSSRNRLTSKTRTIQGSRSGPN